MKETFSVISSKSRLPDPLDSLSQANVVGLELVETGSHGQRSSAETPLEERAGLRNTSLGEVVDDEGPGYTVSRKSYFHLTGPKTYWNPMWEWTTRVAQSRESRSGLREPPAKGAMVRGIRPAETSLFTIDQPALSKHSKIVSGRCYTPLESPVVATVSGGGRGNRSGIVG